MIVPVNGVASPRGVGTGAVFAQRAGADLVELIAEGLTNRQIAERIHLAEKTVKNYVSNVLSKLGMERRTQAAVYAARFSEDR